MVAKINIKLFAHPCKERSRCLTIILSRGVRSCVYQTKHFRSGNSRANDSSLIFNTITNMIQQLCHDMWIFVMISDLNVHLQLCSTCKRFKMIRGPFCLQLPVHHEFTVEAFAPQSWINSFCNNFFGPSDHLPYLPNLCFKIK